MFREDVVFTEYWRAQGHPPQTSFLTTLCYPVTSAIAYLLYPTDATQQHQHHPDNNNNNTSLQHALPQLSEPTAVVEVSHSMRSTEPNASSSPRGGGSGPLQNKNSGSVMTGLHIAIALYVAIVIAIPIAFPLASTSNTIFYAVFFTLLGLPYAAVGLFRRSAFMRRDVQGLGRDQSYFSVLCHVVHLVHLCCLCFHVHTNNPLAEYILLLFLHNNCSIGGPIVYVMVGVIALSFPISSRSTTFQHIVKYLIRIGYVFLLTFLVSVWGRVDASTSTSCYDTSVKIVAGVGIALLVPMTASCCVSRLDAIPTMFKSIVVIIAVLTQHVERTYAIGVVAPYSAVFLFLVYNELKISRSLRDEFGLFTYMVLLGVCWLAAVTLWAQWTTWWGWLILSVAIAGAMGGAMMVARCASSRRQSLRATTSPQQSQLQQNNSSDVIVVASPPRSTVRQHHPQQQQQVAIDFQADTLSGGIGVEMKSREPETSTKPIIMSLYGMTSPNAQEQQQHQQLDSTQPPLVVSTTAPLSQHGSSALITPKHQIAASKSSNLLAATGHDNPLALVDQSQQSLVSPGPTTTHQSEKVSNPLTQLRPPTPTNVSATNIPFGNTPLQQPQNQSTGNGPMVVAALPQEPPEDGVVDLHGSTSSSSSSDRISDNSQFREDSAAIPIEDYKAHCEELLQVISAPASTKAADKYHHHPPLGGDAQSVMSTVIEIPDVLALDSAAVSPQEISSHLSSANALITKCAATDSQMVDMMTRMKFMGTAPSTVYAFKDGVQPYVAPKPPTPPQQSSTPPSVPPEKKSSTIQNGGAVPNNTTCWDANDNRENMDLYCPGGYHPTKEGEVFNGRYVAVKKLGWGEFSIVWLARDASESNRFVALKISRANATYQAASNNELNLCGLVRKRVEDTAVKPLTPEERRNADCVMQMYDTFHHKGPNGNHLVCVLERLGENLLSLMTATQFQGLPARVVKCVAAQILRGLAFLHDEVNIVHADLKPENVLLANYDAQQSKSAPSEDKFAERYAVKISDLGSGRLTTVKYSYCVLQTREYRAPEVILGCESLMGPPMDVWSLACMVFELLTGDFLFDPKAQVPSQQDQDILHINMVMQLMGRVSDKVLAKAKHKNTFFKPTTGQFVKKLLPQTSLYDVMVRTYRMGAKEAKELVDFLQPMLVIDPQLRVTARQHMTHPWLENF